MTKEERSKEARFIVEHALRWCGNILCEVLSNHGEHIHPDARLALRDVTMHLNNASMCNFKAKVNEDDE